MAELINERDSLNDGRKKLNAAIKDSGKALTDSQQALLKAVESMDLSERTQKELTQAILDGDSSPLGGQLSVGADGSEYDGPQERLIAEYEKTSSHLKDAESEVSYTQRGNAHVSPSFVIVDDDGKKEAYEVLKSILDNKGVKASFAIITDRVGDNNYMTESQILELHEEGHDIVSHTKTHGDLSEMAIGEIEEELRGSKGYLNALGIKSSHLMYPYGKNNEMVRGVARKYYKSAATTTNYLRTNHRPLNTFRVGRLGLGVYGAEIDQTLEAFIPYIDEAIESNLMCVFMTHIDETPSDKIQVIEDVIDYVHSKGYDFETYSEAYEKHKNTLDYGDGNFRLGLSGEIYAPDLSIYTADHDKFTSNNSPKDFREKTITINVVRDNATDGLPEHEGGILETIRLSGDDTFTRQIYRTRNTGNSYTRSSNNEGVWGDWNFMGDLEVLISNSVNGLTHADGFPKRKVSTVSVSDDNTNGLPEGKGGVLKTHRLTGDDSTTFQEYQIRDSNRKYSRVWEGKWNEWRIVGSSAFFDGDEFNNNSPATDYPVRAVTNTFIRNSNASGFPEERGGILTTYRMSSGDDFVYQEYKIYNANRKYTRQWTKSGWQPWAQYAFESKVI